MSAAVADLTHETLLSLAQAARRFPSYRLGRPVCPSTVWRWCRKGVKVPGAGVVHLEWVRLAGRLLTSEEAIGRFLAAQTPPPADAPPAPSARTPTQQRRGHERAAKRLESAGI